MSRGVVYVATGKVYVKGVATSIVTLRRFYTGPIMLLTDKPAKYFTQCADKYGVTVNVQATGEAHAGISSRILKTQVARLCPYETALFLDVDTLVLRPICEIWDQLKKPKQIAMTLSEYHPKIKDADKAPHMRRKSYARDLHETKELAGPNFPHYCSSTMLWRRTARVLQLFKTWYEEWDRVRGADMFALARALFKTGLPVALLPRRFSVRRHSKPDVVIYTPRITELAKACKKLCPGLTKVIAADRKQWGWA